MVKLRNRDTQVYFPLMAQVQSDVVSEYSPVTQPESIQITNGKLGLQFRSADRVRSALPAKECKIRDALPKRRSDPIQELMD